MYQHVKKSSCSSHKYKIFFVINLLSNFYEYHLAIFFVTYTVLPTKKYRSIRNGTEGVYFRMWLSISHSTPYVYPPWRKLDHLLQLTIIYFCLLRTILDTLPCNKVYAVERLRLPFEMASWYWNIFMLDSSHRRVIMLKLRGMQEDHGQGWF